MRLEPLDKYFISADSLLRDSIELGLQVVRSGFRPTFLVGIWRGGAPIGIAVQEILEYNGIECDHVSIRTSSYTGIDQQSRTVRVHAIDYLVSSLNAEDQLLLIDDVFDSGRSLEAVIAELRRRCRRNMPEQIRVATVYYQAGPQSQQSDSLILRACDRPVAGVSARDEWTHARGNPRQQAGGRELFHGTPGC